MADPRAHQMRRHATKAEWVLWRELRHYRALGFNLRRQTPFGKYILDFVAHRERLVIEVDGDQHGLQAQRAHDEERTRFLENRGYRVLRFGNQDVLTNLAGVIDGIDAALKERRRLKFAAVPPPEPTSRSATHGSTAPQRGR
jgi:very-short-patch-repair endonuclease